MKSNEGSEHVREKNDLLRRIRGMNRIRRYVFPQPEKQHITGPADAELRGRTQGTIEIKQSIEQGVGPPSSQVVASMLWSVATKARSFHIHPSFKRLVQETVFRRGSMG